MKIFLAGCSGRAYILELAKELGILWKSTLQEKTANGVSYQNYLGGGQNESLSCRRLYRKPCSRMEENSNRGGQKHMNIYLAGEHPVKNGKLAKSIIGGGKE